jgi:hypothetical protein
MKRSADVTITILFLLYYCYYFIMASVFSQMSGPKSYSFIPITLVGLVLITISLFIKNKLAYAVLRLTGIVLAINILYSDLSSSLGFHRKWETVKIIVTYFPVIALFLFILISIARIATFYSVNE